MFLVPKFSVVTCDTPSGTIDLVVPSSDEPLVTAFFKRSSDPSWSAFRSRPGVERENLG